MSEILLLKDAAHGWMTNGDLIYIRKDALENSGASIKGLNIEESLFDPDWLIMSAFNFEKGYQITIEATVSEISKGFWAIISGLYEGKELSASFFFVHDWTMLSMKPYKVLSHLYSLTDDQCMSFIADHNGLKTNKKKGKK